MARITDIIDKLVQRTAQDRVPWTPTDKENNFTAAFGDLSVSISSHSQGLSSITTLSVKDSNDQEIVSAQCDTSHPLSHRRYSKLTDLYNAAKTWASGTDVRLTELMQRIEASPPVQRDKNTSR